MDFLFILASKDLFLEIREYSGCIVRERARNTKSYSSIFKLEEELKIDS